MSIPITAGLLAEYLCSDATGTTLPDNSGNGRNGTLGTGGSFLPTITTKGLTFGSGGEQASAPSGAAAGVKTIYACIKTTWQNPSYQPVLGINGVSGAYMGVRPDGRIGYVLDGYGWCIFQDLRPIDGAAQGSSAVVVAMNVDSASPGKIYLNGSEIPDYFRMGVASPTIPATAGATGLQLGYQPANSQVYPGDLYYLATFSTVHDASQVATMQTYIAGLMSARSVTLAAGRSSNPPLVIQGTSIPLGVNVTSSPGPYSSQLQALLANNYQIINYSLAGSPVSYLSTIASDVDKLLAYDGLGRGILVADTGTNDGFAASSWTTLAAWVTARKAAGWKRIVLVHGLPRTDQNNTTVNNARAAWRASILAACDRRTVFSAMWGDDAEMGQNGQGVTGTYYTDGVHPTSLGHSIAARYVSGAINNMGYDPIPAGGGTIKSGQRRRGR